MNGKQGSRQRGTHEALMSKPCMKSTVTRAARGAASRGADTQDKIQSTAQNLRRTKRFLHVCKVVPRHSASSSKISSVYEEAQGGGHTASRRAPLRVAHQRKNHPKTGLRVMGPARTAPPKTATGSSARVRKAEICRASYRGR